MSRLTVLKVVVVILMVPASAPAGGSAVPVSPGGIDHPSVIEGLCPTFSWTSAVDAEAYELVIYELTADTPAADLALRRTVPGGALSWTPGQQECLGQGKRFAWSIRSWGSNGATNWSTARLFETQARLSADAAAEALAVLGRYLDSGGTLESLMASRPSADTGLSEAPETTETAALQPAPEKEEDGHLPPPDALVVPIGSLGISAFMSEPSDVGTVAVQGVHEGLFGSDSVAGYLGVNIPNTSTDDFVSPYLKALDSDEIGVLGFSANSSDDNFGVVGVGGESAWGGRFLNSDATGTSRIQVKLAGPEAAGYFENSYATGTVRNSVRLADPEAAGYFEGEDNSNPDIVLGGDDDADDGTLWSDPSLPDSDLFIYSNDEVWIHLDEGNTQQSEFRIYNGANAVIHKISEDGTKSAVLQTESYGQRAVYSIESPEVWLEDFGSGSLADGRAKVAFGPMFAETVNRDLDYQVYLAPVCQEPVLLIVTAKTAAGFGVRGVKLDGRPAACDFDYRITAKRLGVEDIRLEEVTDDQVRG